ncbi:tripartite tricarboxylate transporter substrate-binding protein [Roseomonas xinghualingensis]|uniref:tripartite tricarboxylate transporter substrate-binding protein n=1 Tax=Roseomonas xinghualingensis TaxID=2986475 RepID=UPI0036726703
MSDRLTQTLGQPFITENRPGGGGMIATALAARAAPDGYTVLFSQASPSVISPNFQAVSYDTQKDFAPVTQLVSSGLVFVVRPGIEARTVPELVELAKRAKPELTFGSIGPASTTHLAGELLMLKSSVKLLHVPYTGSTQPITDMLAGRLDMGFWNVGAVMPFIQSGQLRPLAVTSAKRSSRLPELPAMAEFYPGFEVNSWYGVMVPSATPQLIIDRLYQAFIEALKQPENVARLKENGLEIEGTTPDQFRQKIVDDLKLWQGVAQATGIRVT